jgi:hypothetical protein
MRISILENRAALSDYLLEMLRAWGLACVERRPARALALDRPPDQQVVIHTGGAENGPGEEELLRFVEEGGTLIALCPRGRLARAAGLDWTRAHDAPLRLRVNGAVVRGLAGESLPIPAAMVYRPAEDATVLAWLYGGDRQGTDDEFPGIVEYSRGKGKIIGFAWDLPRCVMLLRQGDPARANLQLPHDRASKRMFKPSNMALRIEGYDTGWIPFADLLARVMVDIILSQSKGPVPLLSTMPAGASGMLLFSGDEDNARVCDVDRELSEVSDRQARMNLYIIPEQTQSSPADVDRYAKSHDLGPHPDLIPMIDEPAAVRAGEYERQIRLFCEKFQRSPRSIRNHAAGWAGYLDLVHVQHRCGIRMDLNYFSGNYGRQRDHSPFSPFGGALPMRFCEPDGTVLEVFQQHTHLHDDILFAPDRDYSYKFTLEVAANLFERVFEETTRRFQVPLAANFHPGNWLFSREPALMLIRIAREKQMFVWSYDRWLAFWEARDAVRVHEPQWDGASLSFEVEGAGRRKDLCIELPAGWCGRRLVSAACGGRELKWAIQQRDGGAVARIELDAVEERCDCTAVYR